jgi:hypothetical protein
VFQPLLYRTLYLSPHYLKSAKNFELILLLASHVHLARLVRRFSVASYYFDPKLTAAEVAFSTLLMAVENMKSLKLLNIGIDSRVFPGPKQLAMFFKALREHASQLRVLEARCYDPPVTLPEGVIAISGLTRISWSNWAISEGNSSILWSFMVVPKLIVVQLSPRAS